jgi:hypothetical protein
MDANHPGDLPNGGQNGEPGHLLGQTGESVDFRPEEKASGGGLRDGLDLLVERVVPLTQVPRLGIIPARRRGSRLNLRTVYRWTEAGLCGVRLATIAVGGQRVTTVEALLRFFAAVSATKRCKSVLHAKGRGATQTNVDAELDHEGL